MKPIDDTKETVAFRSVSHDEEVEKTEIGTLNIDTLKYVEKKLVDKGVLRLDRHPRDGLPLGKQPKSGRGGKYTWEGPGGVGENELDDVPAAIDEKDPNYVDEEGEVVGTVEGGVARIDVDRHLKVA